MASAKSEAESPKEANLRHSSPVRTLLSYVICIVVALVIAIGVRYFLIEPYRIPTGSMLPTIQLNDMVLANKLVFKVGGAPKYKDIVVFKDPDGDYPQLIKRVIATEGQTIDLRDGVVYVDNKKLDEPYVHGQKTYPLSDVVQFPYTVPQGYMWVMGDNRGNSGDSRLFGAVPLKSLYGRAWWTYWPLKNFGSLK